MIRPAPMAVPSAMPVAQRKTTQCDFLLDCKKRINTGVL
jgi:hypothetical protein